MLRIPPKYALSTVRLDEQMVRACIRNREAENERYDRMKLVMGWAATGGSRFYGGL